jgi:hypothetical protein
MIRGEHIRVRVAQETDLGGWFHSYSDSDHRGEFFADRSPRRSCSHRPFPSTAFGTSRSEAWSLWITTPCRPVRSHGAGRERGVWARVAGTGPGGARRTLPPWRHARARSPFTVGATPAGRATVGAQGSRAQLSRAGEVGGRMETQPAQPGTARGQGLTPHRELRGVVERITYQNPDNGYTVARRGL